MNIGDLVRCIYTNEFYIITSNEGHGYYGVNSLFQMSEEHLEKLG